MINREGALLLRSVQRWLITVADRVAFEVVIVSAGIAVSALVVLFADRHTKAVGAIKDDADRLGGAASRLASGDGAVAALDGVVADRG